MTIEQILDNNIPLKFIPKHKSITYKSNYNYIRNNEVEYEWKLKKKKGGIENVKM